MSAMTTAPPTAPEAWWPSRYGPDDQAGALNEITPAGRVRAARLVREGRVYDLAHVLDEKVPAFAGREFRQYLTTSAHQLNRRAAGAGPEGLGRNNDHHVALTGCDTWSFGPVPAEDPAEPFVVPQTLNAKHGLVVLENLRLAELADEKVGEFMFVVSHAKLRGATGAWVAPLAIV
jgi:kynurenine formamidase